MKIASILPYKKLFQKGAGAVALWISDFLKIQFIKDTFVIGSTSNKKYLTKNYININIDTINSKFSSTTKEYSKKIVNQIKYQNFDIIELHNNQLWLRNFNKVKSKIILYFHNIQKR